MILRLISLVISLIVAVCSSIVLTLSSRRTRTGSRTCTSTSPKAPATAPAPLPPATDVYVKELAEHPAGGCVGLISSGTSSSESAFYDASENGDDVFLMTTSRLVGEDYDKGYDVYDAHVCTTAVPCKRHRSPHHRAPRATRVRQRPHPNPNCSVQRQPRHSMGSATSPRPLARM